MLPTPGSSGEDLEAQLAVVSSALLPILVDSDPDLLVRELKFLNNFRSNRWSRGLGPEVRNGNTQSYLGA
jgi:hypothetical protein